MSAAQLLDKAVSASVPAAKWVQLQRRLQYTEGASDDLGTIYDAILAAINTYGTLSPLPLDYLRTALQENLLGRDEAISRLMGSGDKETPVAVEAVSSVLLDSWTDGGGGGYAGSPSGSVGDLDIDNLGGLEKIMSFAARLDGQLQPKAVRLTIEVLAAGRDRAADQAGFENSVKRILAKFDVNTFPIAIQGYITTLLPHDEIASQTDPEVGMGSDTKASSPEPLSFTLPPNTSSPPSSYIHLQTPLYISIALQHALELGWNIPPGTLQTAVEDHQRYAEMVGAKGGRAIPIASMRLVRLGPVLCSKPATFMHFLLQGSVEMVIQSFAVLTKADQTQRADDAGTFASRIAKSGWREWIWLFDGLLGALQYWRWLSEYAEPGSVWQSRFGIPAKEVVAKSLVALRKDYSARLESLDRAMTGVLGRSSEQSFSTLNLFANQLLVCGLLEQSGHDGFIGNATILRGNQNSVMDIVDLFLVESVPPSTSVTLLANPHAWAEIHMTIISDIENYWSMGGATVAPLTEVGVLLDLMSSMTGASTLLDTALRSFRSPDLLTSMGDDPQASMTKYGALSIFIRMLCSRYRLPLPEDFRDVATVRLVTELTAEENGWLHGWIHAIFGSTGIGDELLQMATPARLLQFSTTLIAQAIAATVAGVISVETLHSGLSYFAQPLLSWCQVGILQWLCGEIRRNDPSTATYVDVLQQFVFAEDFPSTVLHIVAADILSLFEDGNISQHASQLPGVQVARLRSNSAAAIGECGVSGRLTSGAVEDVEQAIHHEIRLLSANAGDPSTGISDLLRLVRILSDDVGGDSAIASLVREMQGEGDAWKVLGVIVHTVGGDSALAQLILYASSSTSGDKGAEDPNPVIALAGLVARYSSMYGRDDRQPDSQAKASGMADTVAAHVHQMGSHHKADVLHTRLLKRVRA